MRAKAVRWYPFLLYATLLTCCALVLLLAQENRQLEKRLYQASLAAAGGPEISAQLSDIAVTELDGVDSTLVLGNAEQESVMLVFTTSCPACQQNVEPWLDLHRRFGEHYEFTAVSLDPLVATHIYAEANELPYRVVIPKDRSAFQESLNIKKVPQTLVVDAAGRVKIVQPGVLSEEFREQLAADNIAAR
ncbi:MAG: thioredoxin family protein [Acidobacteriota bacterium]